MAPSNTLQTDILILGGGVIGLACARALRQRSDTLRIAVLDSPTEAMPASLAAAGMLAPYTEFPEGDSLGRLCVQSLRLYPRYLTDLRLRSGQEIGVNWNGTLIPELPASTERFERRLEQLRKRGVEHRILNERDITAAEPHIAAQVQRALWLPEGVVNPRQLHTALRSACLRQNIHLLEGAALERMEDSSKSLTGLRLEDGRVVEFETLVAATGAWGQAVADLLDVRFPVGPVKGQVVRIQTPDNFLRHILHTTHLYLAPRPGLGIVIGATMEEAGFDISQDEGVAARFRHAAAALLPALADSPIAESWVGFRPKAPDGRPLLGWARRWKNFMVATGHFRNGILLAPITGEIIADLYLEPGMTSHREFSPERFSI